MKNGFFLENFSQAITLEAKNKIDAEIKVDFLKLPLSKFLKNGFVTFELNEKL